MNIESARKLAHTYLADHADILVIGAGHAGCEAAVAAAKLGCKVILFSITLDAVGNMPCNPSIGGTAKGQLVREIDALGGVMGKIADKSAIQYRMLNASKGPAVQSPRAQMDRRMYQDEMKAMLESIPNLRLAQAEVVKILADKDAEAHYKVEGVLTRTGAIYPCSKIVLASGTYLDGHVFIGEHNYPSGPDHLSPAIGLSESLEEYGLQLRRFKTGTPVRVNCRSIQCEILEEQNPDEDLWRFSYEDELDASRPNLKQQQCWLTWTTQETADVIRQNLHRSPLYSGDIEGVGPRYCPSIEDKIVRFPDKLRHQIFIEPMGQKTAEMYLQGLSTSLPEDVQEKIVRSLPGLEKAVIQRSAYAIEYDCLNPLDLLPTLELRKLGGLYGAGQINGSSGYEEAAAQGLIAGINAAQAHLGKPSLILRRDEAYIGVLIDDLVTKGTEEPYRMMTSRAEYRLLLRQDNADMRLTPIGYQLGLIDEERYQKFLYKKTLIETEIDRLHKYRVTGTEEVNRYLRELDVPTLQGGAGLAQLLLRPNMTYEKLSPLDPQRPDLPKVYTKAVEIRIKYQGYIQLEEKRMEKFRKLEEKLLPEDLDYNLISGLRIEAQQKLNKIQPRSIGQASRISGVSPADISVLLVYLEMQRRRHVTNVGEDEMI